MSDIRTLLTPSGCEPALADIVARSPIGAMTYLETRYGKPFTDLVVGFAPAVMKLGCLTAPQTVCARLARPLRTRMRDRPFGLDS
jgi:hypothetical protein